MLSVTRAAFATMAIAAVLAPSAHGATQTIPGSAPNMTIHVGDIGRLQGVLPGMSSGMFFGGSSGPASSGFFLRVKSGAAAGTVYSSFNNAFTLVSNGPVTGNFTPQSPAQVVTVYDAGSPAVARVTQTVLYVGYQKRST